MHSWMQLLERKVRLSVHWQRNVQMHSLQVRLLRMHANEPILLKKNWRNV